MTRLTAACVTILLAAALAGCGSGNTTSKAKTAADAGSASATTKPDSSESFDRNNWEDRSLLSPHADKGALVDFVGKVFIAPERDAQGNDVQVWEDPQNDENNTIVAYADPNFQVQDGDYLHVVGTVKGKFSGKNAFARS